MTTTVQQIMERTIEGMHPRHVFGEPIEREGVTFLPVAKVVGGGGGGSDTEGNGGGGFGLTARPAGMYVIRDGAATWQPALDLNRVIIGGQLVAIVALLVLRSILKNRH
ncbi:MAG: spore germination protein GerW family protein [Candidatus Limnocylindria bacterium]